MNKKFFMIAALACALTLGATICAEAADGRAQRYQIQPYGQALTPDQREQARQIYNETFAATERTRQELADRRDRLDRELSSPNPDGGRIEALSREIGELRGKLLAARAEARARLAQQGLPPDGYGAYWDGPRGDYWHRGWNRHYNGRWHGHGHGPGCWNDYCGGMMGGMMGW